MLVRVIRGAGGASWVRTNKRHLGYFQAVNLFVIEIPKFNLDENSFPRTNSMPRIRICYLFGLAIGLMAENYSSRFYFYEEKNNISVKLRFLDVV